VGSRETPLDILEMMVRIGRTMAEQRVGLSSGDAIRADQAFYRGACLHRENVAVGERVVPNRIYLAWNGIAGRHHDPENGWYAAPFYKDTYEKASQLALEARGSFEGLTRGGIGQHVRNVYQIHGHTLTEPVIALWYWGIPVGKKEKVRGGTNTALQLSIKAGVPNRINLYTDEGLERAVRFLAKYESGKPYPKDLLEGVALERS
jgi:hypothetical protein